MFAEEEANAIQAVFAWRSGSLSLIITPLFEEAVFLMAFFMLQSISRRQLNLLSIYSIMENENQELGESLAGKEHS